MYRGWNQTKRSFRSNHHHSLIGLYDCYFFTVELIAQKAGADDFYFLLAEANGQVMAALKVSLVLCNERREECKKQTCT